MPLLVMVHPLSPHTENVKNVSANVRKTASSTVAVTVTFLSLTATSAGIPLATASIMDMIYICWSIRKVIFRYFPIIPVLPTHDSHGFLQAFFRMRSFLPDYKVSKVLLDSAHDAMPYYQYFKRQNITPFIDLNSKGWKTTCL